VYARRIAAKLLRGGHNCLLEKKGTHRLPEVGMCASLKFFYVVRLNNIFVSPFGNLTVTDCGELTDHMP
jgi:hypothetical protein